MGARNPFLMVLDQFETVLGHFLGVSAFWGVFPPPFPPKLNKILFPLVPTCSHLFPPVPTPDTSHRVETPEGGGGNRFVFLPPVSTCTVTLCATKASGGARNPGTSGDRIFRMREEYLGGHSALQHKYHHKHKPFSRELKWEAPLPPFVLN